MKEETATLPRATRKPTRLPTKPDGTVDPIRLGEIAQKLIRLGATLTCAEVAAILELGEIQNKHELEQPLTTFEESARKAAEEIPAAEGSTRGFILGYARRLYKQHLDRQIRENGGWIVTERFRGGQLVERREDHFPPPKSVEIANQARRSTPRARGAGRPKAQSTRSSARSGDSGDEREPAESEPPSERAPCEWCGAELSHKNADARHCNDVHRVYANRAKDKANPDRVAARSVESGTNGRAAVCRCDPPGHLVADGHCITCGHDRVGAAA